MWCTLKPTGVFNSITWTSSSWCYEDDNQRLQCNVIISEANCLTFNKWLKNYSNRNTPDVSICRIVTFTNSFLQNNQNKVKLLEYFSYYSLRFKLIYVNCLLLNMTSAQILKKKLIQHRLIIMRSFDELNKTAEYYTRNSPECNQERHSKTI